MVIGLHAELGRGIAMNKCSKCDQNTMTVKFVSKGSLINSSSTKRVENEFISSSEYDYFYKLNAKKDHLLKNCKCGYAVRVRAADDKTIA